MISLLLSVQSFSWPPLLFSLVPPSSARTLYCNVILSVRSVFICPVSLSSHAFVPKPPPPPPLCMLKYSVKEGSRGGSRGERAAWRGGIGGGGGGNIDDKSAAVVMIFCSLFLGTSGPLRATVSSTVFTGSWSEEDEGVRHLTRSELCSRWRK